MAAQPKVKYTPDEYLALERQAEYRSEYVDGEIFAMAGASGRHNRICLNIAGALDDQVGGASCRVYAIEMKVRVSSRRYYYPDVVATCGQAEFEDTVADTVLNPTLVVEVLSKSTQDYDRGEKAQFYRALPSLRELLFVAQDEHRVEHYVRKTEREWSLVEYIGLDEVIPLPALGCQLPLRDIYRRIDIDVEE